MKREVATHCLQLGDHKVIVDAGSRAEAYWMGLGYGFAGGAACGTTDLAILDRSYPDPLILSSVEPTQVIASTAGDGKLNRRGRRPGAVAGS